MRSTAVGLTAGSAGVWWSYHLSEHSIGADVLPFVVFWLSFAAALVPLLIAALREHNSHLRWAAVMTAGLFTTWPKVLRTWGGPLYSDEFGHLYQTKRVLQEGMFPDGANPLLKVAPDFPLLHWLTAGLAELGVDLWLAANIVAGSSHVLTLLAVFFLVDVVTGSSKAGVIGAFFYVMQPGWLFFNAQFAYETLALPLLISTLALSLWARSQDGRRRTAALVGVVVGAAATVLAHHFAAFVLVVLIAASIAAGNRTAEPHLETRRGDMLAPLAASALAAMWLLVRSEALSDYYGPTFEALLGVFSSNSTSTTRTAFSGSTAPTFERVAGFGFPIAAFAVYVVAVLQRWGTLRDRQVETMFTILGGSFFASLPLIFTVAGSEAAHRWWSYSFIGLAVLFGSVFSQIRLDTISTPVKTVAAFVVAVIAIGGAASGTTVAYRFPGPEQVGNDARSVSAEGREVAEWLLDRYGPAADSGIAVLADRYTAQQVVGFGLQRTARPSPGYPAWDLLFTTSPAELRQLADMLADDQVSVVIVDTRMATDRPVLGYWFNRTEPGAFGDVLVDDAAIAKFDCASWSTPIHRSGHLSVYEVDTTVLANRPEVCR